jgi:hypothetical protein
VIWDFEIRSIFLPDKASKATSSSKTCKSKLSIAQSSVIEVAVFAALCLEQQTLSFKENVMAEPWVKGTLDEQRVWLAPTWQSDADVPGVNRTQLQRYLTRIGRLNGIAFFVTFTREEDSGMDGAAVAGNQVVAYSSQRGFPINDYVVLAVLRSKRKNRQAGQYVYAAGMRVGRKLRRAGLSDADLARIMNEAGHWIMWDNPDPSPSDFAAEVASKIVEELSPGFRGAQLGSASLDPGTDLRSVRGHVYGRIKRK